MSLLANLGTGSVQEIMENVRSAAEEKADYDIVLDITGSDINGRMIEIAKANAEEIGLGSFDCL